MSIFFQVHVDLQIKQAKPDKVAELALLYRFCPLQFKTELLAASQTLFAFLCWRALSKLVLAVFMWLTCSGPTSSKTTSKSFRIRENPRSYQRQIIQLWVCLEIFLLCVYMGLQDSSLTLPYIWWFKILFHITAFFWRGTVMKQSFMCTRGVNENTKAAVPLCVP